jgi:hypothetical protein
MEEKLDQVIKLLEQQNQAIERLIRLQTTNNFSKQHSPRSMVGREGMPDVKNKDEYTSLPSRSYTHRSF